VAMTIPYYCLSQVRARRARKLEEQFPEAIDLLSRALRAGHALTTGLAMVADELPEPMGGEFRLLHDQQTFGRPVPEALKNFAVRVPAPDARFFVTAVLTQRDAGGNLSELLDNLSAIIRDRFRVKRQIRVISAHGRITGWVLAGLTPTLVLVFMYIMPENYASFYRDPLGIRMIVVAVLLQLAGIAMIRKIVNIEY
jgi:tight adherence protein B